jgi:hypothetical protein
MGEHTNAIPGKNPPAPSARQRPARSMMLMMLFVRKMRKFRWFLRTMPAPSPNQGMAEMLEEATAEFERHYREEVKGRN